METKNVEDLIHGLTEIVVKGFDRIEKRFDQMDEKFIDLTEIAINGFERLDTRIDSLEDELERNSV